MNPSWIKRAEMTLSNGRFDQQLMGNTFGQPKENGQRMSKVGFPCLFVDLLEGMSGGYVGNKDRDYRQL